MRSWEELTESFTLVAQGRRDIVGSCDRQTMDATSKLHTSCFIVNSPEDDAMVVLYPCMKARSRLIVAVTVSALTGVVARACSFARRYASGRAFASFS
jgi:hypothetical protein